MSWQSRHSRHQLMHNERIGVNDVDIDIHSVIYCKVNHCKIFSLSLDISFTCWKDKKIRFKRWEKSKFNSIENWLRNCESLGLRLLFLHFSFTQFNMNFHFSFAFALDKIEWKLIFHSTSNGIIKCLWKFVSKSNEMAQFFSL